MALPKEFHGKLCTTNDTKYLSLRFGEDPIYVLYNIRHPLYVKNITSAK